MKKIVTLLALTISFSMNAQMDDNSANNNTAGRYAVAMGSSTTASGYASTAMGWGTTAVGVLAQEIKEVFPELISEDDNEMLAETYQG